jgi:hypothetical protein
VNTPDISWPIDPGGAAQHRHSLSDYTDDQDNDSKVGVRLFVA